MSHKSRQIKIFEGKPSAIYKLDSLSRGHSFSRGLCFLWGLRFLGGLRFWVLGLRFLDSRWKFKGFVPQLVPKKIDRTGDKEYFKLYSLSSIPVKSPERTVNGGPGRPKDEIDEETLLHFRAWDSSGKTSQNFFLFRVGLCGDGYERLVSPR